MDELRLLVNPHSSLWSVPQASLFHVSGIWLDGTSTLTLLLGLCVALTEASQLAVPRAKTGKGLEPGQAGEEGVGVR